MKKPNTLVLRQQSRPFDYLLFFSILVLTGFGLLMVADASAVQAQNYFGDKLFYVKGQVAAAAVGIVGFLLASILPLRFWEKMAIPLLILTVIMLISVFIPGIGIGALGARRWVNLGDFNFQPAELAKLTLILYLARFLGNKVRILPFFIIVGTIAGLVLAEPDFGTTSIIVATSFAMLFMSGASALLFLGLAPLLVVAGGLLIWLSDYRRERLLTYLGEISDPLRSSYHISQVLIALSSGGLLGVGLGQSRAKYLFLPEAATDSIFAVIGEEFGFIGATILILIFVFIVTRMFRIAMRSQDPFAKLVASGIATWIGAQAFLNIAAMTAIVPITGIPLPFISYGGTALVGMLVASGIVLGISRQQVQEV